MAYTALNFLPFEVLTSTKMNQAAANDAFFKDLIDKVGTDTVFNNVPYQANTSNSVRDSVLIQHGYGVMTTGAAQLKTESVTFPTAYDSAPIVIITPGGDDTGGGTTLGNGGAEDKQFSCRAHTVTTTGFTATAETLDATNWGSGTTVFYHWIAIGVNT